MSRKGLFIGIDHYDHQPPLNGCADDALRLKSLLDRHHDGRLNFQSLVLSGTSPTDPVSKSAMKDAVRELFDADPDVAPEIALLYFSGHGYAEDTGGYLCGSEVKGGDEGLALSEIMTIADASPAQSKVIILDSCFSGSAAEHPVLGEGSVIRSGMTILTAATSTQVALGGATAPGGGSGSVFTNLLLDALNGAARNLAGDVTPGSVYAHIDQSLGSWGQRPVFKTNVKKFVSLRQAEAPIEAELVRQLTTIFPTPDYELPLDPSFEPERNSDQLADPDFPPPDPVNTAVFKTLQKYNSVNLAEPVDAPHMWHAAVGSKSCRLTVVGQHWWNVVNENLF